MSVSFCLSKSVTNSFYFCPFNSWLLSLLIRDAGVACNFMQVRNSTEERSEINEEPQGAEKSYLRPYPQLDLQYNCSIKRSVVDSNLCA